MEVRYYRYYLGVVGRRKMLCFPSTVHLFQHILELKSRWLCLMVMKILSTKDTTHIRRNVGRIGATINFVSDMQLDMTKDLFLANKTNKQRFIGLLSTYLNTNGIETKQAHGDADLLIAETAIEVAETHHVVVFVDDTDLLILLCCYDKHDSCKVIFNPQARKHT